MEFIETPTFTRLVLGLMADENYGKLQASLANHPEAGKIIPGSGGIRKMRWAGSGRGKRGGLRVIYYWQMSQQQIWMLAIYAKNVKDDLSKSEIKQLKRLVEEFER
jgi:hypothetical protein